METTRIVEALLFASEVPLTAAELARADDSLDEDDVEQAIRTLRREYDTGEHAFQIQELAGGYQLLTRAEFAPYLERFEAVPQTGRLSVAALEVLAVIAYRQPIGRAEIEDIRGVSSAGVLRTLQDRGLVDVIGRGEGLGRPLLYGTTRRFLEHFGFNSLHDLPRPEELPVVLRQPEPTDVLAQGSHDRAAENGAAGNGAAKGAAGNGAHTAAAAHDSSGSANVAAVDGAANGSGAPSNGGAANGSRPAAATTNGAHANGSRPAAATTNGAHANGRS